MDLLDDAESALTKAASLRPDNPTYQYALAAAKVGKREFQAAEDLLESRSKVQGELTRSSNTRLGSVLYLEGHLAEASTHLRESVRLLPEQLAPYYYLALVARDQGNDAEAIRHLRGFASALSRPCFVL